MCRAIYTINVNYLRYALQMGQLNGGGQLSQLHIGPVGAGGGGGGHQASSPSLLSAASQTYQIGSAAPNTAPTMITHHQLSPVSANITLMGQSNGKSSSSPSPVIVYLLNIQSGSSSIPAHHAVWCSTSSLFSSRGLLAFLPHALVRRYITIAILSLENLRIKINS